VKTQNGPPFFESPPQNNTLFEKNAPNSNKKSLGVKKTHPVSNIKGPPKYVKGWK